MNGRVKWSNLNKIYELWTIKIRIFYLVLQNWWKNVSGEFHWLEFSPAITLCMQKSLKILLSSCILLTYLLGTFMFLQFSLTPCQLLRWFVRVEVSTCWSWRAFHWHIVILTAYCEHSFWLVLRWHEMLIFKNNTFYVGTENNCFLTSCVRDFRVIFIMLSNYQDTWF